MRRINWKTVSTLITMVAVAGCADRVLAPAPSSATSARFAPVGHPTLSLNVAATEEGAEDFTVGPNGGVFFIGRNAVVFPKGSICDPSTSTYGIGTWDQPCTPLSSTIKVHAVTHSSPGSNWVDFSPSLRFVPTNDVSKYVWMFMSTPGAARSTNLSAFTIYYAPTIGGATYDESLTDPTLTTYVDSKSGASFRRIKHFSGYTASGVACDPATSLDPTCKDPNNGGGPLQ